MKVIKFIFNLITYLLLLFLLMYLVVVLYQKIFKKASLPSFNNIYLFQVVSGSMKDELLTGDYIFVKKTDKFKEGDIVTFKENDYYVTHRIKKIDGNKIITKGDANDVVDDTIDKKQLVGKMICKAYVLTFISRYNILFSAILIAWLIIGYQIDKIRNKKE